jgi:signal recognition particle subunit SRP54
MFDTLSDRLDGVFKKLRSRGKLHPKQVDNALGDIRIALLEADVAVEVADDLLERVRARGLSAEVMKSVTPAQQVVKIMDEELTATLGGSSTRFTLPASGRGMPAVVMLAGVQGRARPPPAPSWPSTWKGRASGRSSNAADPDRPAAVSSSAPSAGRSACRCVGGTRRSVSRRTG